MTLAATGYVSSPAYGLRLDLHEGRTDAADLAELHRFGEHGAGELYILDVPKYDYALPGKIGSAVLDAVAQDGFYEASYGFGDDDLSRWGRKGLMTEAMHVLLGRLIEQDVHASVVTFNIHKGNKPSIGLATKLGAAPASDSAEMYELSLTDYLSRQSRNKVRHGQAGAAR